MSYAPIAVFAYRRVDHLQRLLQSLEVCAEFSTTDVIIFVDGPKGEADYAEVAQVREFASSCKLPNVTIKISNTNKGLKRSICEGVTFVCSQYGRVIVMEDDLIASPSLLRYFNSALDRYKSDERVFSISGYIYDCPALRSINRALVLPITNSWGWATWQRAWSGFDPEELIDNETIKSPTFRNRFDINGFYPLASLLELSIERSVDSWFIHWYYYIFRCGGVTIYPPRRYVENHGMREGATHGSILNPFHLFVREQPEILDKDIQLPPTAVIDYWAMDVLKRCREVTVHRWISRAGRWKRKLLAQKRS